MAEVEGEGMYVEGKGIVYVARHLYMYAAVWFFLYHTNSAIFVLS